VFPYFDVKGSRKELEKVKVALLSLGCGSTLRSGFLRIQGINNCLIISAFIENDGKRWWLDCLKMFEKGMHLTRSGIVKIVKKRPMTLNMKCRIPIQEIINNVMEF
jgi:hypothetical protein